MCVKKKILIIGSNSDIAKTLMFGDKFDFIALSSQTSNFNILDKKTFPKIEELDGLVYFPGSINLKPFNSLKVDDFSNDYEINVMGLINILQHYHSNLNKNSSLVFISSIAATVGLKFHASISMCKAAIESLTRTLASEFSPKIRVNCISPAIIETKLSDRILRNEAIKNKIINDNPMKRIGRPDDIAHAIEFLLSEKSSWITGQSISVDGGLNNLKI